ncbi:MAG: Gfo/Idh/MocA family oxidoreductase [Clostridia bacterium]|nr:Gfo/Idh/MocA family oxidoreductase [Clostridia bacterium]
MEKKPRIGIFGCWRGRELAKCLKLAGADIVAVCDKNPEMLEKIRPYMAEGAAAYDNFDDFIEHDLEACVLTNYFCEHAAYAIRLLERGITVLSECASNITMAEGVALVRAVEASGAKYMLVENYPYYRASMEMRKIYRSGKLGKAIFAEGEYVHPLSTEDALELAPTPDHWRNHIPPTYYNTHSLGPLMYFTESMPQSISAQAVCCPERTAGTYGKNDPFALMTCKMSDGSIFAFSGWANMAGHCSWYRLHGTRGVMESGRFDFPHNKVKITYNKWEIPEGEKKTNDYEVDYPFDGEKAEGTGHYGSDYYIAHEFVSVVRGEKEPFFDVYRATAMASCGILGWRSCLENGKPYRIPDFRNEEDRKLYENDTASPFVKADGTVDIPCSIEPERMQ